MGLGYIKHLAFLLAILFASDVSAKKKVASVYNEPFLVVSP
jgi:hypothetical protein